METEQSPPRMDSTTEMLGKKMAIVQVSTMKDKVTTKFALLEKLGSL